MITEKRSFTYLKLLLLVHRGNGTHVNTASARLIPTRLVLEILGGSLIASTRQGKVTPSTRLECFWRETHQLERELELSVFKQKPDLPKEQPNLSAILQHMCGSEQSYFAVRFDNRLRKNPEPPDWTTTSYTANACRNRK